MDSTVAVELLRVRSDDGAQRSGFNGRGQCHYQRLLLVVLQLLLLVVIVLLVIGVRRKCRYRIVDDDTLMRVVFVLDVEDLHLLLLLLSVHDDGFRGQFQRVVAVLDNDLDDRLGGLNVLGIVLWRAMVLLLLAVVTLVHISSSIRGIVRRLLRFRVVKSRGDPSLEFRLGPAVVRGALLSPITSFGQFAGRGIALVRWRCTAQSYGEQCYYYLDGGVAWERGEERKECSHY